MLPFELRSSLHAASARGLQRLVPHPVSAGQTDGPTSDRRTPVSIASYRIESDTPISFGLRRNRMSQLGIEDTASGDAKHEWSRLDQVWQVKFAASPYTALGSCIIRGPSLTILSDLDIWLPLISSLRFWTRRLRGEFRTRSVKLTHEKFSISPLRYSSTREAATSRVPGGWLPRLDPLRTPERSQKIRSVRTQAGYTS